MTDFVFAYNLEKVEFDDDCDIEYGEGYEDEDEDEYLFVLNFRTDLYTNKITFPLSYIKEKQELLTLCNNLIDIITNDTKNKSAYAHHENGGLSIKFVNDKIHFLIDYCNLSNELSFNITNEMKKTILDNTIKVIQKLNDLKL